MRNSKIKVYFLVYLILACACFAFYWNTLHNPFILDDEGLIVKNSFILDWNLWPKAFMTGMHFGNMGGSNFYRPLQTLSFMWDYHFWRLNPLGYHLTNILLQSAAAFLVFFLVLSLGIKPAIAFVTSLFFAVNPLHTETVAYISGRADMLMAIFLLLSLLLFTKSQNLQKHPRALCLLLSLFFFVLGLLSKELAFVFPLVLAAFVFYYARDNFRKPWYFTLALLPFFIIDFLYLILRHTLWQFSTLWVAELSRYTLALRLSVLPAVFFTYIRLLFFPVGLHMSRAVAAPGAFVAISLWVLLILFIGAAYYAISRVNKKWAYFLFWLYLIFLTPQLGVYPINAFLAEHFLYLSSISFFAAATYFLAKHLKKSLFVFSVSALLLFYGFLTLARNYEWGNPVIFYERMAKFSPQSFLAHNNLGVQYIYQRRLDEAIAEFKQAIKIRPDRLDARLNLAKAYQSQGRFRDAEDEYKILERITPYDKAAELQNEIAALYEARGERNKAAARYRLALRLDPNLYFVHFNLARLIGNLDQATAEIIRSLPEADERQNKGVFEVVKQYIRESRDYGCAVTFYNNLGTRLAQAGLSKEAIASFKRALGLAPEYADAHFNLGLAYLNSGYKAEAVAQFRAALAIDPRHYKAKALLCGIAR